MDKDEELQQDSEELKPGEGPRDRFKRLATQRTNEVLKRLKILGNCASRRNYDYSPEDIYKIFDAIEKKVRETKSKFFDAKEQEFKI